ncbi:putative metal-dependent hydrolase YfiT [Posidoniimonas corsicana]|uniref:Putative metal-dependent hydrolase YfiT n=1 Tax=Posidoniimonas corsicana TaxID=1938618 RepID=A0A5C5VJC3_9BACT|nr:putative metal-dependent hydrolase [Posidoniimonas corsicana]TWT37989.1 putative metal-dependent hydrolase YfiT [Posidoniimonas corsicana]
MPPDPPQNPVGAFTPPAENQVDLSACIAGIETQPSQLAATVDGLLDDQLDTKYRNWTIRQIVHHLADSHVHSYVRFKWALTEDHPTIKAYDETLWSDLAESREGTIQPSLMLLGGLHARWGKLLRSMPRGDFSRGFHHPESGEDVCLASALAYYEWHGRHHTGQIAWVKKERLGL